MKIIDLLNKIANGEEVPKKIRFDNTNWNKVYGEKYIYYTDDCDNDLFIYFFRNNLTFNLNDDIEIIEEDKKEDKKIKRIGKLNQVEDKQNLNNYMLRDKINEIIDKLNKEE